MSDSMHISGPVEIEQSSEANAALELMKHIAAWEDLPKESKKNRKYWLTLYYQCRKATRGVGTLSSVLEEK